MIGGFPVLSVLGYLVMWGGAVHVVTEPVIVGAKRYGRSRRSLGAGGSSRQWLTPWT
jgi:hypothetical protein